MDYFNFSPIFFLISWVKREDGMHQLIWMTLSFQGDISFYQNVVVLVEGTLHCVIGDVDLCFVTTFSLQEKRNQLTIGCRQLWWCSWFHLPSPSLSHGWNQVVVQSAHSTSSWKFPEQESLDLFAFKYLTRSQFFTRRKKTTKYPDVFQILSGLLPSSDSHCRLLPLCYTLGVLCIRLTCTHAGFTHLMFFCCQTVHWVKSSLKMRSKKVPNNGYKKKNFFFPISWCMSCM